MNPRDNDNCCIIDFDGGGVSAKERTAARWCIVTTTMGCDSYSRFRIKLQRVGSSGANGWTRPSPEITANRSELI